MAQLASAAPIAALLAVVTACASGGVEPAPPACAGGQQACGDACFDLQTDVLHCGACGVACPATQLCAGGSCGCPGGTTACGTTCVDLAASVAHCGACDTPCPEGATCSGGTCVAVCTPPETACGLACADLATSASACGSCGRACAVGATCAGGACTASACTGLVDLPGAPVHPWPATALVSGDLDGDLRPDLVGSSNDVVTVRRSVGAGRFALAQTLALPAGAWVDALALARLDADGHLDLAGADRRGYVHVAPGNGDGTFGTVVSFPVGAGADGVAAADLDGDADLDLAVSAEGQTGVGSATVLWNDGAGGFPTRLELGPTGRASDVAVGDVNGDARPDVLVSVYAASRVDVHLASSTVRGAFEPVQHVTTGGLNQALALADLDGDGRLDLVTSATGNGQVALGNGDGTFASAVDWFVGALGLAIADVDEDGDLDVAFSSGDLLLGAGDGTFARSTAQSSSYGSSAIVADDLDGDGRSDLAYGDGIVALRTETGWLVPYRPIDFALALVGVGDVNGDGDPDLVGIDDAQRLVAALGRGDGGFAPPATGTPALGLDPLRPAALADLDGDARLDVVASSASAVATWLGGGDGSFAAGPTLASAVVGLAAVDLDGDGGADLLTLEEDPESTESGFLRLRLGTGGGAFGPPALLAPDATAFAAGDMDGDGAIDVVVGRRYGLSLDVLLGAGDGTFAAPLGFTIGSVASGIAIGDVDGDGVLDLAVASFLRSDRPSSFLATVRGLGGGALGAVAIASEALAGTGPGTPLLADLDSDGRDDLLVWTDALGWLALLRNGGDGTFLAPVFEPVRFQPAAAAVADLDRDGRPDLVVDEISGVGVRVLRTGCRP